MQNETTLLMWMKGMNGWENVKLLFISMPLSSISNLRNVVVESHLLAPIESWVRDIGVVSSCCIGPRARSPGMLTLLQ
jgi:hypothetical protein